MPAPPHTNLEVLVPASRCYFGARLFLSVLLVPVAVVLLYGAFAIVHEAWVGRPLKGSLLFGPLFAFGAFSCLRHAIWFVREGLGAERSFEGRILQLTENQTSRLTLLWVEVEAGLFRVPHALAPKLWVGQYVSARVGRFHGDLISLSVSGGKRDCRASQAVARRAPPRS
jgi:hypothetical protein